MKKTKATAKKKTSTSSVGKAAVKKTLVGTPVSQDHRKFYQDHPNAEMLIQFFLICFVVLVLVYMMRMY